MNVLLATNVVSELRRPSPDIKVSRWIDELDEDRIFLSVITLAEIRFGIARLGSARRRTALTHWLDIELADRFAGRVIPIEQEIAFTWGDLRHASQRTGHALSAMDGLIAATALMRRLVLATRNTRDFAGLDVELIDPWVA